MYDVIGIALSKRTIFLRNILSTSIKPASSKFWINARILLSFHKQRQLSHCWIQLQEHNQTSCLRYFRYTTSKFKYTYR